MDGEIDPEKGADMFQVPISSQRELDHREAQRHTQAEA
jgi:hypothetical protein